MPRARSTGRAWAASSASCRASPARHDAAPSEPPRRAIFAREDAAIMAKAPVGIALTRHRRFELVSAEFNRLLGYEEAGLEGEAPRLIYASDEFYQALGTRVAAAFAVTQLFSEEIEFLRRDGTRFWGQLQGAPVSPGDAGAGTIWILEDVSATRRERDALSYRHPRCVDALCKPPAIETPMAQQLASNASRRPRCSTSPSTASRRSTTAPATRPDRLLKDVAAILEARLRADDVVARLGGDDSRSCLPTARMPARSASPRTSPSNRGPPLWWKGDPACASARHWRRRDRPGLRGSGCRRRGGRRCLLRRQARRQERRPRARYRRAQPGQVTPRAAGVRTHRRGPIPRPDRLPAH